MRRRKGLGAREQGIESRRAAITVVAVYPGLKGETWGTRQEFRLRPFKTQFRIRLQRLGQGFGGFAHLGGALDLVPVEGLAVDGALEGLEEHDGEDLAVGEALQPDVEEQPAVALVGGMAALQAEGDRRGDEVDEQEAEEVGQQLFEAGRRRRLRGGSGGR